MPRNTKVFGVIPIRLFRKYVLSRISMTDILKFARISRASRVCASQSFISKECETRMRGATHCETLRELYMWLIASQDRYFIYYCAKTLHIADLYKYWLNNYSDADFMRRVDGIHELLCLYAVNLGPDNFAACLNVNLPISFENGGTVHAIMMILPDVLKSFGAGYIAPLLLYIERRHEEARNNHLCLRIMNNIKSHGFLDIYRQMRRDYICIWWRENIPHDDFAPASFVAASNAGLENNELMEALFDCIVMQSITLLGIYVMINYKHVDITPLLSVFRFLNEKYIYTRDSFAI